MKKRIIIYSVALGSLFIVSLMGIYLSRISDARAALKLLGKGDREYEQARRQLVLSSSDAQKVILNFIQKKDVSRRARLQALDILKVIVSHQKTTQGGSVLAEILSRSNDKDEQIHLLNVLEFLPDTSGYRAIKNLLKSTSDTAILNRSFHALQGATEKNVDKLYDAFIRQDSSIIDSLWTILKPYPAGKGRLLPELSDYLKKQGKFDSASTVFRNIGLIKKWWVMGGFENSKMSGFHRDYGPEKKPFDSLAKFPVSSTDSANWFRLNRIPHDGIIEIKTLFVKQLYSMAYFHTYLHSPENRSVFLLLGSDDGVKIWLNKKLVYVNKVFRPVIPDDDIIKLDLSRGSNSLMIKVAQDVGGWALLARLTGTDGHGVNNIGFSYDGIRDKTPVEDLIVAIENNTKSAEDLIKERIANNELPGPDLLGIINDPSKPSSQRKSAIYLLRRLNSGMNFRFGERELLSVANNNSGTGGNQQLLSEALHALAAMESPRALDIALQVRDKSSFPPAVYHSNQILNLYVSNTIINLGNPEVEENKPGILRALTELNSLNPSGPWPQERLITFNLMANDTTTATHFMQKIKMPSRWLFRRGGTSDSSAALKFSMGNISTRSIFDTLAPAPKGWSKIPQDPDKWNFYGAAMSKNAYGSNIPEDEYSFLSTAIKSDRAESVVMNVTLPLNYWVILNGKKIGERGTYEPTDYNLWPDYKPQSSRMDVKAFKVTIQPGINQIVIPFWGKAETNTYVNIFRLAFHDQWGENLGTSQNVIQWNR